MWCRPTDIGPERIQVTSDRRFEREANRFAAALLMPEELLRHEAEAARISIPLLAKRFDVSARAMQIRLEVLKMLPDYMQ